MVGIGEGTFRNAYRSVYPRRDELVDYEMLEDIREKKRFPGLSMAYFLGATATFDRSR